ncbi:TPA: Fe-S cluster assembly ATPase SufC [archaeon]|uniref:Fe-S cluster assembly ATPase SufC n=1 Tax=Candidatus Naiadarchaeum limnaeum TaxID=2756139 RepID=A0A832V1D4_9ARCH|nr:Fe-S cluster assembly ATPase SufC [Candidatus Naiadarchaeum limnaeum]
MADLEIKNLHVEIEGKEILKGVNLSVNKNEVVAIMGPNGAGKSTLGYAVMGHPKYKITKGQILFKGQDIAKLSPDKRARLGLFLSFQYPSEISGVSVFNFLRTAVNSVRGQPVPVLEFQKTLWNTMAMLKMPQEFAQRNLNEGFSGGEKKRAEILQMAILKPQVAVLDETDSGLDIDALKTVADGVQSLISPELGVLLITHYTRILNYIKPDRVHVMLNGRIVKTGGAELAKQLEEKGYEWVEKEYAASVK